jgi:hypothetical protein
MNMRSSITAFLLLACGNGGVASDAGTKDATNESSAVVFHLKGQIVDSTTGAPIPYAYVGIGPFQESTDSTGSYDQVVDPIGSISTYAAAPDGGTSWVLTLDQLVNVVGDVDRGKTPINGLLYEQSIRGALTIPLGGGVAILRVTVIGIGACTDVTGATISVPNVVGPDAGPNTGKPVLVYFAGAPAMPDESRTSVTAGVTPSALVYNLPVSNSMSLFDQITVQHPTCKQAPFPVNDPVAPNIQYTGSVYIQDSADSNKPLAASTMRLFLQ